VSRGYHKRKKQIEAGTYEPHNRLERSRAVLDGFYESVRKSLAEMQEKYDNDPEFRKQIDEWKKGNPAPV
jgi:vacuolar-type H+-ATPase subunit E/Vma4